MQLYVGNKNYSSWSMRAWVLMKQAGIPFDEVMLRFDAFTPGSNFKARIGSVSAAGRVPVLVDDGLAVWDSLAIAEYLAERFPDRRLWPDERSARAHARAACAEMHSGFSALRHHLPMNIEARLPEIGQRVLHEQPDVLVDVNRVLQIWSTALAASGGPMLFGSFGIIDAFFAPVVMRFRSYDVPVPAEVRAYMQRLVELPGVAAWISDAMREHDFLDFEEPYRAKPAD